MVTHLRKAFPQTVTSETVKKLGLASNNESYVINALQFIGIIDEDGKKTPEASSAFSNHKDDEFSKSFGELVKKSYSALFELHGESSWALDIDELITFFRTSDQTSDAIGRRQANTFKTFAALSGYGEISIPKNTKSTTVSTKAKIKTKTSMKDSTVQKPEVKIETPQTRTKDFGLTVRVEINLPSDGTKETYDNIFKSIKENLIDG